MFFDDKSKFSFIKGINYPLITTSENMKNFLTLTCFFSLVMTVISLLLGRAFLCSFKLSFDLDVGVFCSSGVFNTVVSLIINLIGISLYVNKVGLIKEKQEKMFWFLHGIKWKQVLKSFMIVFLYLLFWGVIGYSLSYLLYIRQPVSDWKAEVSIFVLISLLMLVCFFLLLNFVVFIHYLHGGKLCEIKKVFWPIFDEVFKLMALFFIYMFIFSILFFTISRSFISNMNFLNVTCNEFLMYFLLYFMVAIIYFSYEYQEKFLFSEEK